MTNGMLGQSLTNADQVFSKLISVLKQNQIFERSNRNLRCLLFHTNIKIIFWLRFSSMKGL